MLPMQAARAALVALAALAALALRPAVAPKAWTWRGGSAVLTGRAGEYGPCGHWEQLAWDDCRLQYDAATCAAAAELGLRDCDAFEGDAWPGARAGHALAADARDDGVWLFGGVGTGADQAGLLNDLWYLLPMQPGVQTGVWRWYGGEQAPAPLRPSSRSGDAGQRTAGTSSRPVAPRTEARFLARLPRARQRARACVSARCPCLLQLEWEQPVVGGVRSAGGGRGAQMYPQSAHTHSPSQ